MATDSAAATESSSSGGLLALGEPVLGKLNYSLRADADAVAAFKARTAALSDATAPGQAAKGTEGAGRFFSDTKEMAVHDVRPCIDDLSIDVHGVIVARKPGGAWDFSDSLETVLDPRDEELRAIYYPELEQLALSSVVTADGRRAKYAVCAGTQKFTEHKERGYLGAYSRQIHNDIFEIRPDYDDTSTALWDPSFWDASKMRTESGVYGPSAELEAPPLVHPYSGIVFGGAFSTASQYSRRGEKPPPGASTADGPENLLRKRGISVEEARGMDLMMVNAWRPFSWPVVDNPLAVLDWSSVDEAADLYRIPAGLPMTPGEPPQRITYNSAHRWMYVSEMRPDEVLFFKQGDTRVGTERDTAAAAAAAGAAAAAAGRGLSKFCFHTSFRLPDDPGGPEGHRTRRALASRLMLLFEKPQGSVAAPKL